MFLNNIIDMFPNQLQIQVFVNVKQIAVVIGFFVISSYPKILLNSF